MQADVKSERSLFNRADHPAAERRLNEVVALFATSARKHSAWMEANLPQGFAVFALPLAPSNCVCAPASRWKESRRNSNAAPALTMAVRISAFPGHVLNPQ